MIYSKELEHRLLACLIQHPDQYGEIASFITENDFASTEHKITTTIFSAIKSFCENGKPLDHVILSEKVKSLGFSFPSNFQISEYIHSLSLQTLNKAQTIDVARELKKYTIRREIYESAKKTAEKIHSLAPDASFNEIIETADKTFNEKIDIYDLVQDNFSNIYGDEMEGYIEGLGNNPVDEMGFMGPYQIINDLYGSLLRPGNITVIVARSGVGKTRFCLDYCTKVAEKYDIPVLHFDNGEMSRNELMIRMCSGLSGVSSHLLETGQWRLAGDEVVQKVRSVWPRVKKLKFYYHGVGGYSLEKMINILKRFYYSRIGRGNPMLFSFDYIKPTEEQGKAEWQTIGKMVDTFKRTIQRDIVVNGEPIIPMLTSIQSNRSGIVTNRQAVDLNDDEGIVSGSDRVTQYCSHLFILREKTMDEQVQETERFGTHKLIKIKARHLGRLTRRASSPVQMPDRMVSNSIQLRMDGFNVDCLGDQQDVADFLDADDHITAIGDNNESVSSDDFESGNVPDTLL